MGNCSRTPRVMLLVHMPLQLFHVLHSAADGNDDGDCCGDSDVCRDGGSVVISMAVMVVVLVVVATVLEMTSGGGWRRNCSLFVVLSPLQPAAAAACILHLPPQPGV